MNSTHLAPLLCALALGCAVEDVEIAAPMPELSPEQRIMPLESAVRTPAALAANAAPSWSAGRALAATTDRLIALDRANGAVVAFDRDSLTVTSSVAVGGHPHHVVVGPNDDIWVTEPRTDRVLRMGGAPLAITDTLSLGRGPRGLAMSQDGARLYVALHTDAQLVTFDAATGSELGRLSTFSAPVALAATPTALAVVHQYGPTQRLPLTLGLPGAGAANWELRSTNPWSRDPFQDRAPGQASAATVGGLDAEAVHVVHTIANTGASPAEAAGRAEPSDDTGDYASTDDRMSAPIEPAVTTVSHTPPDDRPEAHFGVSAFANTDRPAAQRVASPSDINHHPTLALLFVTGEGSDNMLALDTRQDPMRYVVAEIEVGMAPQAVAFSPDGRFAYTLDAHSFTVSETDLSPLLSLPPDAVVEPLTLRASRSVAFGVDPSPPAIQRGRRIFTFVGDPSVAENARFACASCHTNGTEDKRVWFVDEGPRQPPALAGRLADTAPFNWSGEHSELTGAVVDAVDRMRGQGLTEHQLSDLMEFMMNGLEAEPNPNISAAGLTPEQELGRQLFNDPTVGCASCHSGPALTDGRAWDVGTATITDQFSSLDTPSLRGLWDTAPYLHDGSAHDLYDVLQRTEGTMGKTAHLIDSERDALVAYLLTL